MVIRESDFSFRAWCSCHKNETINKTKIFDVHSGHSKKFPEAMKPSLNCSDGLASSSDIGHEELSPLQMCQPHCGDPARSCIFFWIFDSQRHNDNAKLQTWPVLLPFPKEIDCIKCVVVWLRIKEIDFFFWICRLKMMKWSLMDSSSENGIRRNAGREMMQRNDG